MIFRKCKELSGHSAGVYSLAFDQSYIYSGSADKFVARWDLERGVQDNFAIRFESPVYSICLISNNEKLVVGLANGDLHVFDLNERKEIKFYQQHKTALFAISSNPAKGHFYVADADGNLSVWDETTLDLLLYLPLDCGKIRRSAVSTSGRFMAVACQDGNFRVFDSENYNEIATVNAHKGGTTSLLFDPSDESALFTGGKDAWMRSWNWEIGSLLKEIPAHNYVIYDIISLDEGQTLVTASRDKTIKVWNKDHLSFIQRLDLKAGGHRHSVNCLIKMDERSFASGSDDKRMILFEKMPDAE
jgi:WD40 repeat protein